MDLSSFYNIFISFFVRNPSLKNARRFYERKNAKFRRQICVYLKIVYKEAKCVCAADAHNCMCHIKEFLDLNFKWFLTKYNFSQNSSKNHILTKIVI